MTDDEEGGQRTDDRGPKKEGLDRPRTDDRRPTTEEGVLDRPRTEDGGRPRRTDDRGPTTVDGRRLKVGEFGSLKAEREQPIQTAQLKLSNFQTAKQGRGRRLTDD